MSYYQHHVFFCLNERKNGEDSCALHNAQEGFDRCKAKVKAEGLSGPGKVRVNKAGCLDRCAGGPIVVVYPDAIASSAPGPTNPNGCYDWWGYSNQVDPNYALKSGAQMSRKSS